MREISKHWGFLTRSVLGIVLLVPTSLAVIFSHPTFPYKSLLDLAFDVLGWLAFALYVIFRLWATLYVGGRKGRELQTSGPYSITRNPLYFGSLCFGLSVVLFFKSATLLFALSIVILWYWYVVIGTEESLLYAKFGDSFASYCARTPRLIPRLSHYVQTEEEVPVNLKALKLETERLWRALLFPLTVEMIMYLRELSWWPHLW